MKKILLTSWSMLLSMLYINAQNFTPVTNDSTFYGSNTDPDFFGYININNDLGVSQSMYWEVETMDLPSQWEFSVCDQDICYPIGTNGVQWTLPFSQGYLNMHFYPNGQEGEGFVTLRVSDSPDGNQQELITFRGNALSQASVDEENLSQIEVYPNPVNNMLSVNGDQVGSTYYISNLQGKLIHKGVMGQNSVIDVSFLKKGVYLFNLIGEGQTFRKKIIKN